MRTLSHRRRVLGLFMTATATLLAGCGGASGAPGQTRAGASDARATALVAWPARDQWPAAFNQAAPTTQAAYRFAVSPAGQALLRWMPCYCGCHESDGHTSNLDCYIDDIRPDGSVLLDGMSFG